MKQSSRLRALRRDTVSLLFVVRGLWDSWIGRSVLNKYRKCFCRLRDFEVKNMLREESKHLSLTNVN